MVAGSRGYNNFDYFEEEMFYILTHFNTSECIFISGKASSGADDLIIRFCKKHGFPWVEFPADWEKDKKAAGYIRNKAMAEAGTDLVAFWDGKSKGTRNMINLAKSHKFATITIVPLEEAGSCEEHCFT